MEEPSFGLAPKVNLVFVVGDMAPEDQSLSGFVFILLILCCCCFHVFGCYRYGFIYLFVSAIVSLRV